MVHGLFVAMLPTQLGGDLDYVARDMSFEFVRPVFCGDTIHCALTVREVRREGDRTWIEADVVCTTSTAER